MPDKYAGKAIRCPACNRAITVPKPKAAVGGAVGRAALDLEALARLEAGTSELDAEEREALEQDLEAKSAAAPADSHLRTCPHCNYQTKVDDPLVDILCPHCWKSIPALTTGGLGGKKMRQQKPAGATGPGGFYSELAASVAYPIPALASLLAAAGIAFGAALVPVAVMTGAANLMEQSAVGTVEGVQAADLSGVQMILIAIFSMEVFFFSAVAIHAFFDVVRTTSIRDDQPPKLSFSPKQWSKSFLSYVILAAYFAVMTYLVAQITFEGDFQAYVLRGDIDGLLATGGSAFAVGMVIVSFFVPMNLLGISLGNIGQALNPANVLKSVANTHVHYVFLVLILSLYGGMFGYAFMAILFKWFIPQIDAMFSGSSQGNLIQVALPLLAWGAVMASFFYGTYILARLHGLFARSFRKELLFGGA